MATVLVSVGVLNPDKSAAFINTAAVIAGAITSNRKPRQTARAGL